MLNLFFYAFFAFSATIFLSKMLLVFCPARFFQDLPDEYRKIHMRNTPRYGGIPFAFVMSLCMAFIWGDQLGLLIVGAWGCLLLGFWDDFKGLTWKVKISVQLVIGCLVCYVVIQHVPNIYFFGFQLVDMPIVVAGLFLFWFVGITNAVNLIDGMDGLAGGVVFIISLGLLFLGYQAQSELFVLHVVSFMASLYGFLVFNSRPAKFFMGDTGSLFLGYNLAIAPILFYFFSENRGVLDISPFLIIVSYLIFDTLRVFVVRLKLKRHPFQPDNAHFHHLLFHATRSYNTTLLCIFSVVVVCVCVGGWVSTQAYSFWSMIVYLGLGVLIVGWSKWVSGLVVVMVKCVRLGRRVLNQVLSNKKRLPQRLMNVILLSYLSLCIADLLVLDWHLSFLVWLVCLLFVSLLLQYWLPNSNVFSLFMTGGYFFMRSLSGNVYVFSPSGIGGVEIVKFALLCAMILLGCRFVVEYVGLYSLRYWKNDDLLMIIFIWGVFISVVFFQHWELFPAFFELLVFYFGFRLLWLSLVLDRKGG